MTLTLLAGCGPDVGSPPEANTEPLLVEVSGCRATVPLMGGSGCIVDDNGELRFWTAEPNVEIAIDANTVAVEGTEVGGGYRWILPVPAGSREVRVTLAGKSPWLLALAEETRPDWSDGVQDREDMEAFLRQKAAEGTSAEQAAAHEQLIRWAWSNGDQRLLRDVLWEAVEAYRSAGRRQEEIRQAGNFVFVVGIQGRQFDEAREVLDLVEVDALVAKGHSERFETVEVAYFLDFYQGSMAKEVADYRSANESLEAAAALARRHRLDGWERMAEEALGTILPLTGRFEEADTLFARLAQGQEECSLAGVLSNQAWARLLAHEAGNATEDPLPLLQEAQRLFDGECGRDRQRSNVRVNLALAHLQQGRLTEARAALEEARQLGAETNELQYLWQLDIEARIRLAGEQPEEALTAYREMQERSQKVLYSEGLWRAALGRARVFDLLGQPEKALVALTEAEALLDGQSLAIPLGTGRDSFVAQRQRAVELHIDLLLRLDQPAEALAVARRSRSRLLRGLRRDSRLASLPEADRLAWYEAIAEYRSRRAKLGEGIADDWQLAADELARRQSDREAQEAELANVLDRALALLGDEPADIPPVEPGEVVLAFHPLAEGWAAFSTSGHEVRAWRFELPALDQPNDLARCLIEPFRDEILAAKRVRLLPYGPLRELDFHALPFDGDILLASRPVTYGLDVLTAVDPESSESRAVVVADPRGDLPAARREADVVRQALDSDWQVEVLEGNEAGFAAVRTSLANADLLHYAGHGVFQGQGGWESALPLAGQTQLALGDLLALERAPRWVVLSGCETARSAAGAIESVGLAHGFLVAGSRGVVAAVRPVGDQAAKNLVRDLYQDWDGDLAVRLQQAQLAWRALEPDADWASFRVLEP